MKEAALKKDKALAKLIAAKEADRESALVGFIEDRINTGAIYAGQYSAFRTLGWDVEKLLQQWMVESPDEAMSGDNFRAACIGALRDLVDADKATDELRAALRKLTEDELESPMIKDRAAYALAQFGDRSLVVKQIKRATDMTKAEDLSSQARGWSALSNICYHLREYGNAAKAYVQMIKLIDDSKIGYPEERLASLLYNSACSMALAGQKEKALARVERALKTGRKSGNQLRKSLLETDMDIASLRGEKRFPELMEEYFGVKKKKAPKEGTDSKPTSQPAKGDKGK